MGSDLIGEAALDLFGLVGVLSLRRAAIVWSLVHLTMTNRYHPTPYAGLVQIYDWTGSQCMQVESELDDKVAGERFGGSIAPKSKQRPHHQGQS